MKSKLIAKTSIFKIYQIGGKIENKDLEFEYVSVNDIHRSVMVAAMTADRELIFIRQYFQAMNKYGLVLPGGKIEKDEKGKDAATRELAEETGYLASRIERQGVLDIFPKYFKGETELYIATDLKETNKFLGDEKLKPAVVIVPLKNIRQMILSRKIMDSRTVAFCFMILNKFAIG